MDEFNFTSLLNHHEKVINVIDEPFSYSVTNSFFPINTIKSISSSFEFANNLNLTSDALFQKTKRAQNDYNIFPLEIKKTVDYLNSKEFLNILKINLKFQTL